MAKTPEQVLSSLVNHQGVTNEERDLVILFLNLMEGLLQAHGCPCEACLHARNILLALMPPETVS